MGVPVKMKAFIPPAGDAALQSDFDGYHPDPVFQGKQMDAMMDWKGASLPFIKAETGLGVVDVPQKLEHMIKHCWKAASVAPGAARGPVTIGGGARQAAFNKLGKSMNPADIIKQANQRIAGTHTKQVQPLDPGALASIPHLKGIATDWKTTESLPRVSAYTFRGDTRAPALIVKDNGFNPPISRTDTYYVDNVVFKYFAGYMKRRYNLDVTKAQFDRAYKDELPPGTDGRMVLNNFFVWRTLVENEQFHAGRMLACEALKGYISTTRAVAVARGFARAGGWVYLTLVRGGFLIPDKGKTEWTKIFGEQEIALPCALPWAEVFGFRQLDVDKNLAGPVYLRKNFEGRNKAAFNEAFELLSGKPQ